MRDIVFVYVVMRYALHIHYETSVEVSMLIGAAGYFERDAVDKFTTHCKRIAAKSPVVIARRSTIKGEGE